MDSPIVVILAGMALGLGLLGMVVTMITRVVSYEGAAWTQDDLDVDENDVDAEWIDEEEPPAAPEWEPVCHYCGVGFDSDERKCKHCGGRRLQLSPDLPGK